jgi:hypothetical protein
MVSWGEVKTTGAPSWEIIHEKDPELYKKRYYEEVLSKLDPEQVASDLEGSVLLCHEKDSTFCHRKIVAEWLEAALGIKVPEMEHAVNKMPSLWDFVKKEEKADDKIEISTVKIVPWKDSWPKANSLPVEKLKVINKRPGESPDLGLNLYAGCSIIAGTAITSGLIETQIGHTINHRRKQVILCISSMTFKNCCVLVI